jgi:hypothetical protein
MTSISVGILLLQIRRWAASASGVSRVIISGSQASHIDSAEPIGKSDVDLVIYLERDVDKNRVMQELAEIGLSSKALLHPLFISEEEKGMKESIREYKSMIESGKQVYP